VTLGVAILRRSANLITVQKTGESYSIILERRIERNPGAQPAQILQILLSDISLPDKHVSLAISLSPADLACGDAWSLPENLSGKSASRVGAALCETRCASETLETLAVDAPLSDSAVQAVALDREEVEAILKAAGAIKVTMMTAVPAALAQVFGTVFLTQGGERFEVAPRDGIPTWRAYPVDGPDETGSLAWNGQNIPCEQAAAFATAMCDPDSVPNLLNAFPQHRKIFLKRFRNPLINIGAAAILCLAALGVHLHRIAVREQAETAAARQLERTLWQKFLPGEEPRKGRLLATMNARMGDLGEAGGGGDFLSALAFWGEIGKQMPDPETLGMTLESLDLAPDGGRISARVPTQKDDPLKNAARLEGQLNQSKKMSARGDYEVREGQVQVRLRMDYRP
jgi:hypothetical protein